MSLRGGQSYGNYQFGRRSNLFLERLLRAFYLKLKIKCPRNDILLILHYGLALDQPGHTETKNGRRFQPKQRSEFKNGRSLRHQF